MLVALLLFACAGPGGQEANPSDEDVRLRPGTVPDGFHLVQDREHQRPKTGERIHERVWIDGRVPEGPRFFLTVAYGPRASELHHQLESNPDAVRTTVRGRPAIALFGAPAPDATPQGEGGTPQSLELSWREQDGIWVLLAGARMGERATRAVAEGLESVAGDAARPKEVDVQVQWDDTGGTVTLTVLPGTHEICAEVSGPRGGGGACFPLPRTAPVDFVVRGGGAYAVGPVSDKARTVRVDVGGGSPVEAEVVRSRLLPTAFFGASIPAGTSVSAVVALDDDSELGVATGPAADVPGPPDVSIPRPPVSPAAPLPGG